MPQSTNYVRVPKNRIGVIIGPKGSTKKELERTLHCKIDVDSDSGEVIIIPNEDLVDPVLMLKSGEVIKAIGRGFTPAQALKLLNDDFYLEIIPLRQLGGTSANAIRRLRSRLIGTGGKTRKTIEEYTKVSMVILGNTVSLIGRFTSLVDAKEAINKLANGANHTSVYAWLEEKRKERIRNEEDLTWDTEALKNISLDEMDALLKKDKGEELDLEEEFDQLIEDEKS